jgi:DNA-binding Lrp family transcriptional regulator
MKANIGKIDYHIIKRLNENARLSSNAIAEELHVSQRTVKNHITYLIDNDIIKPIAVVNPGMFGYNNITDISL